MGFESEKVAVTELGLVVLFYIPPIVHMFFDAMTQVAAKIQVLISHVFYGLINDTVKFMHAGSRCSNIFKKSVKLSLSMFAII